MHEPQRPTMNAWTIPLARWYFTHCALGKGKWTMWRRFVRRPAYRAFAAGSQQTAYGFQMWLEPTEPIDRFIYFWGAWEPDEAWLIDHLLRPGDVFVDVGANEGFHTLVGSCRVGPTGQVVAFEPVPPTVERLQRNLELNDVHNVEVVAAACVESPTKIRLARRTEEQSSGVYSMRTQGTADSWLVDGRRMDDALAHLTAPIRLVKMDIEGAEMLALRGFTGHLARSDAPLVLCEVTDSFLRAMGASAHGLYEFMAGFGYRPYRLQGRELVALDVADASRQFQLNVLFTKSSDAATLLRST